MPTQNQCRRRLPGSPRFKQMLRMLQQCLRTESLWRTKQPTLNHSNNNSARNCNGKKNNNQCNDGYQHQSKNSSNKNSRLTSNDDINYDDDDDANEEMYYSPPTSPPDNVVLLDSPMKDQLQFNNPEQRPKLVPTTVMVLMYWPQNDQTGTALG